MDYMVVLELLLLHKYFPIILQSQCQCYSFLHALHVNLNFVLFAGEGEIRKGPEGIPLKGVGQGIGAQQWRQWSNP